MQREKYKQLYEKKYKLLLLITLAQCLVLGRGASSAGGPGEVVVDDVLGVAVVRFQAAADSSHLGHVDVGNEDAKVV